MTLGICNIEHKDNQIRAANSAQITYSFVNILLSLGIGLLSTIFALYALDEAISNKTTSGNSLTDSQFKTAKVLNIVAAILIGARWLVIILFILSIQKA
jgi:multisubunit Na+/H+ antiporter MnhB subunit